VDGSYRRAEELGALLGARVDAAGLEVLEEGGALANPLQVVHHLGRRRGECGRGSPAGRRQAHGSLTECMIATEPHALEICCFMNHTACEAAPRLTPRARFRASICEYG